MTAVNKTYDLLPDADQEVYLEYSERAICKMLQAHEIVEIRVISSLLGTTQLRLLGCWRTKVGKDDRNNDSRCPLSS